eukprot:TRINITY_DN7092_c0_g1_i1.p1 TRINITY_DN7092_c0_g1~~TRINITY_DN7092_c0_g1_i1.p1  ORF type:complete len:592 (+),score=69.03 TRINITY_DN7092_c0_g1_i1:64-1776(+)
MSGNSDGGYNHSDSDDIEYMGVGLSQSESTNSKKSQASFEIPVESSKFCRVSEDNTDLCRRGSNDCLEVIELAGSRDETSTTMTTARASTLSRSSCLTSPISVGHIGSLKGSSLVSMDTHRTSSSTRRILARRNNKRDRNSDCSQDSLYELAHGGTSPEEKRGNNALSILAQPVQLSGSQSERSISIVSDTPMGRWFSDKDVSIKTKILVVTSPVWIFSIVVLAFLIETNGGSHIVGGVFGLIIASLLSCMTLKMVQESVTFTTELITEEVQLRKKMEEAANRFVPHEFLTLLGHTSVNTTTAGDRKISEVAILFSDIRDFTFLSQAFDNMEAFDWLNNITGRLTPVIRKWNGFVNKYLGDGTRCIFKTADDALQAASEMQQALDAHNEARTHEVNTTRRVEMGIGIHYGNAILGILGDAERLDTTMIGDAVNIANTLEYYTKSYGCRTLISQQVKDRLSPGVLFIRPIAKIPIRHIADPVVIYDSFAGDVLAVRSYKIVIQKPFEMGFQAYIEGDYVRSVEFLQECASLTTVTYVDKAVEVRLFFAKARLQEKEQGKQLASFDGTDAWL